MSRLVRDSSTEDFQMKGGTGHRYLICSLTGEEDPMSLLGVKEVIGLTEITSIPYSPSYFKDRFIKNITRKDKRLIFNLYVEATLIIADRIMIENQQSKLTA